MHSERRALYTSLRMNWQNNPNLSVEPWKVEDYRKLSAEKLFERLSLQGFNLDRPTYIQLANDYDTPEELTTHLLEEGEFDQTSADQIYLIVFELWRRFVPEKPSLSIFCDELDYLINLHDRGMIPNEESLQDVLANLVSILEENGDEGVDPLDAFDAISQNCANDLEAFIYDFIAEQIDSSNDIYASELLDDFAPYIRDVKWFDFLRLRLLASTDPKMAAQWIKQLIEESSQEPDLEYNLELLSILITYGQREDYVKLMLKTLPLIETEEDFQDFLALSADFYHHLDDETIENFIQEILKKRSKEAHEKAFSLNDPDAKALKSKLV